MNIAFIGEHKGLFAWFSTVFKNHTVLHVPKHPNTTPFTADIIFYVYSAGSPLYWNITETPTTKKVWIGKMPRQPMDHWLMNFDVFASFSPLEKSYAPKHFIYLPQPIDITDFEASGLDITRPQKIVTASTVKKFAYITKDVCRDLRIECEVCRKLAHSDYLALVKNQATLFVDNFSRGMFGTASLEAMALGIPVICGIKQEAEDMVTQAFGSFPPIIKVPMEDLEEDSFESERYTKIRSRIESVIQDNYVSVGAESRLWMEQNFTPQKLVALYEACL